MDIPSIDSEETALVGELKSVETGAKITEQISVIKLQLADRDSVFTNMSRNRLLNNFDKKLHNGGGRK